MARIPGVRSIFRLPTAEGRVSGEVEEEIGFHLEERARELEAGGMAPTDARAQALREFGDVNETRAELEWIGRRRVRSARRSRWWSDLHGDVRYAGRGLLRSSGFTAVAVLTLALGIGAATAIFSVVNGVLLRPFGVAHPERLVTIREWRPAKSSEPPRGVAGTVKPANFFDWEAQSRSFSSMSYFFETPVNLTGAGNPQEAQAQLVSASFFSTLGVQPILGRGFRPEEADPGGKETGGAHVAVLSYGLWQGRFGGDPGVLGKQVEVDGTRRQVIGVMGPDFRVLSLEPDLWLPFGIQHGAPTGRFLTGIGRLKPGVTADQANRELDRVAARLERAHPDYDSGFRTYVLPWREEVLGEVRPALLVLLGAVAMLLLIACTNVANLLLGRASTRRQETAVRLSLGATRGRLVRQFLTESLVLSLAGGVIGLAAAAVGTRALVRAIPASVQLPRLDMVSMDGRVLGFALGATLLTGLLFGLAPALAASRSNLQRTLRDGRGSTGGRAPMRLRNALVVAEVALALVLLMGAGLLLRSFQNLQAVDTGMRPRGVLTVHMGLTTPEYRENAARLAFVDRLLPALRSLPGVVAVGSIQWLPLTGASRTAAWRGDQPKPAPGHEHGADVRAVAGQYFRAQGIPLLRGRRLDAHDDARSVPVAVVNEALARELFPGEDPVGKHVVYQWDEDTDVEVVGVVKDVRESSLTEPPATALYLPLAQFPQANLNIVIRTTGDPLALSGPVRARVRELDPNLPVASIRTMDSVVADASARSRLSSLLLAAFATSALLLAAVGLYGIIAYAVAQRRSEIGVRLALGAGRSDIVRLVVAKGMMLTLIGLASGLVAALLLTRLLRTLLFGVTSTDPLTYAAVPLLLAGVALLASYLPARRAAALDPTSAIRAE